MKKYRKKPVVIEAIQFFESEFLKRDSKYSNIPIQDKAMLSEIWLPRNANDGRYYINTLEGHMIVGEGDYIIKGVQGEFIPSKEDVFLKTYEPVT